MRWAGDLHSTSVSVEVSATAEHYQDDDEQSSRVHFSLPSGSRRILQAATVCGEHGRASVQLSTPARQAIRYDRFTVARRSPRACAERPMARCDKRLRVRSRCPRHWRTEDDRALNSARSRPSAANVRTFGRPTQSSICGGETDMCSPPLSSFNLSRYGANVNASRGCS